MYNVFTLVEDNIEKEQFYHLLNYCFSAADYFTLSKHSNMKYSTRIEVMLSELEQFMVTDVVTEHWHCYYVQKENAIKVLVFHASEESKQILKKFFDNLYLYGKGDTLEDGLEDLCFFSNKTLLLGTVSHEKIANFYSKVNLSEELLRIAKWKKSEEQEHLVREIMILDL